MWIADEKNAASDEDRYEPGSKDEVRGGDRWMTMPLYTERRGYESFKLEGELVVA